MNKIEYIFFRILNFLYKNKFFELSLELEKVSKKKEHSS